LPPPVGIGRSERRESHEENHSYHRSHLAPRPHRDGIWQSITIQSQAEGPKPTLIPLKVQIPAPTPPDSRQVAILTLHINSDSKGNIEAIKMEDARIIKSYAPNVLDRTGPWTVELLGEKEIRFGVMDPRWQEAYLPKESEEVFQSEYATEVVWELVVPLYIYDKDIHVEKINLYDQQGELIFETTVNREDWQ
jgi:hypothetical protein